MNPYEIPFALFAFVAFVAVAPVVMYFVYQHPAASALSTEAHFMAMLAFPAMAGLWLASWFQPGG